jgi:hypothetical protein
VQRQDDESHESEAQQKRTPVGAAGGQLRCNHGRERAFSSLAVFGVADPPVPDPAPAPVRLRGAAPSTLPCPRGGMMASGAPTYTGEFLEPGAAGIRGRASASGGHGQT